MKKWLLGLIGVLLAVITIYFVTEQAKRPAETIDLVAEAAYVGEEDGRHVVRYTIVNQEELPFVLHFKERVPLQVTVTGDRGESFGAEVTELEEKEVVLDPLIPVTWDISFEDDDSETYHFDVQLQANNYDATSSFSFDVQ